MTLTPRQRQVVRSTLLAIALLACAPTESTSPKPMPVEAPAFDRAIEAVDSLNAAVRDLYRAGGDLIYIYVVRFPADSAMPPIVAASLRKP